MTTKTWRATWRENQVLDYFWTMSRDPEVDRLDLLRQLARVELERPSDWDKWGVRQGMIGMRVELTTERCFACLTEERRLYWHHIITVDHGGSSAPGNLVSLCHRCHRSVHPWLPEPTTRENRFGWTSLRDIADRALDKLMAMLESRQIRKK